MRYMVCARRRVCDREVRVHSKKHYIDRNGAATLSSNKNARQKASAIDSSDRQVILLYALSN
jgi:hypothetical protein